MTHQTGKRKLKEVGDLELYNSPVKLLMEKYSVPMQTVVRERAFRRDLDDFIVVRLSTLRRIGYPGLKAFLDSGGPATSANLERSAAAL
jgi:hypothetical protein